MGLRMMSQALQMLFDHQIAHWQSLTQGLVISKLILRRKRWSTLCLDWNLNLCRIRLRHTGVAPETPRVLNPLVVLWKKNSMSRRSSRC
jgi:hypothetical protein